VSSNAVVFLTGAILGFISVFFGYPGALFATAVAGGSVAYYATLRRYTDVGWLFIGAGSVVAALLGRGLVTGAIDPAISISPPTYFGTAVGMLLLGIGAMVLRVAHMLRGRG
jgi:hypothetical protein